MRLLPPQWAAFVVLLVDAVVVLFALVTGHALLPRAANVLLTVISIAVMFGTLLWSKGGFGYDSVGSMWKLLRRTLPVWLVVAATIAFWGGVFLFAYPLLTEPDIGSLDEAANQRGWVGLAAAFAAGSLFYAGIGRRAADSR
ncbi:hypothetical protein AB0E59_24150 [Lentzea sp. NPDC034063]|uniref:hypothetical protein n=1 Tax=unclassified Lentzea TaxID=2643253 RepID=UPI0033EED0B0